MRFRSVPLVGALLLGACNPFPAPVPGAAYTVRDTAPYANVLEEGTLGVLYRDGAYVDSIDLDFGIWPVGGDTVLIRRVHSIPSEEIPPVELYAAEHALVHRAGATELDQLLPYYNPDFSWPVVLNRRIHYWGLQERAAGDFRILAMRYDLAGARVDSVFLFRDPVATDDWSIFLPPKAEGESVVFESRGRRWVLGPGFSVLSAPPRAAPLPRH